MKMDPLAALFAVAFAVIIIVGVIIWQARAVNNFYQDHADRVEAREGDKVFRKTPLDLTGAAEEAVRSRL
jgi:uncharacterized iron-regulated membrane protein